MKDKWQKWKDLFGSEYTYIMKLGACLQDPEEKKAFWETVKEKKNKDPKYSIYDDYPPAECATKRAMRECMKAVSSMAVPKVKESVDPVVNEEHKALQKLFGDAIEIGGHNVSVCLWPRRSA